MSRNSAANLPATITRPPGLRPPNGKVAMTIEFHVPRLDNSRTLLADRGGILDAIQNEYPGAAEQSRLIRRGRQIAEELGTLAPDQVRGTLMALLSRVDIKPDRVEINIPRSRLVCTENLNPDIVMMKSAKDRV